MFRTDENNNPTAFTTDIAKEAGLVFGLDYQTGTPFEAGAVTYFTAKLLGDPIAITIRVIDKLGFYVGDGPPIQRWAYIALLYAVWSRLTATQKRAIIGVMYTFEGGTAMKGLFA